MFKEIKNIRYRIMSLIDDEKEEKRWYKKMWSVEIDEDFKKNVDMLPDDLKKRLYVWCMRIFWRNYVPLTAKVPSWYETKIKIDRVLYDARQENIHFMHLPFNTLPENKRWIMGCQCNYCKDYGKKGRLGRVYLDGEYKKLLNDPLYFHKIMPSSEASDWNNLESIQGVKYFDPFFDSEYEDLIIQAVRKNHPIDFLSETMNGIDIFEFTFETEELDDL